jgi:anaerobic ribonucleoside-triphosphate reductase
MTILDEKIGEQSRRFKNPDEAEGLFWYAYHKTHGNSAFYNGLPKDITDIISKVKGDPLKNLRYLMQEIPNSREYLSRNRYGAPAFYHYSTFLMEFVERYRSMRSKIKKYKMEDIVGILLEISNSVKETKSQQIRENLRNNPFEKKINKCVLKLPEDTISDNGLVKEMLLDDY